MSLTAVVLAAGRATRLRPLTERIAKPALSFAGRSILDRVLDHLAAAGVTDAIVNLHHAPDTVRDLVARRGSALPRVTFSDETAELLGTGGALVPLRERLREGGTFLLVNGDCVHDIDIAALLARHAETGATCTLATRPTSQPGFGALLVDDRGGVTVFGSPARGDKHERHFLSVQACEPELIDWLPRSPPSPASFDSFRAWHPAALLGGATFRVFETDAEWHALDSRELFLGALADHLARRGRDAFKVVPVAETASVRGGSSIEAGAVVGEGALVEGSVVFEGARIGQGASIVRSLVGPGVVVPEGTVVTDRILASDGPAA